MNFIQVLVLGSIAGFTIYLGLPLGRIQGISAQARTFLTTLSAGILTFLLFDIFGNIKEPIEEAVKEAAAGQGNTWYALGLIGILVVGLGVGLIGLVLFESRFLNFRRESGQPISTARLAMMIAAGLGLHNFSEGLAIGQSAGQGQITFALLLIVGFGLHNATEGFGIVGPLAGTRPSWGFLALAGLVGGGPTLLGTLIGYNFVSSALSVLFLSLAAGAILYVLGELFHGGRRAGFKMVAASGLLLGFLVAYATELVLVLAGA